MLKRFQMSVNLHMSQAMNVKMGGGGQSRMTSNAQMVSQQSQQQQPQHPSHPQHPQHPQHSQHPQHHHQQQQPTPQQHPSMMRTQQQQSFTQQQQQQATMNTGNPYQRNMAAGYGANPHQQQYQPTSTAMQPAPVANQTAMLNTNNGLPPRNSFSPSDFNFDFLDQPLASDNKNGFNNKQQTFGDFNFDFLDAH